MIGDRRIRVLIVHAHHGRSTCDGAGTREALSALTDAGHEVVVLDLYGVDLGLGEYADKRSTSKGRLTG